MILMPIFRSEAEALEIVVAKGLQSWLSKSPRRAGGAIPKKAKTWWLHFGVVPRESFLDFGILAYASGE